MYIDVWCNMYCVLVCLVSSVEVCTLSYIERHQLRRSICMFVVRCLAGFHEERAILLGRFGRHQQALSIYIHILHDSVTAEE